MNRTIRTTLLSLGCFWDPEDYFSKLAGVLSTRVGYTGGSLPYPTYSKLGDHTESVEIVYDSEIISFSSLLEHFWQQHDPTPHQPTQYKSIIFVANEEEKKVAEDSRRKAQSRYSRPILTEIRNVSVLYPAEEYHQKYMQKLRSKPLH
jgi:peptide-methionine (S)-S-oxide reductase